MIDKIQEKIEQTENQMSKLIDLYVAGNIAPDLFNKKQEQLQNKIEKLKMNLRSVETVISSEDKIENGIKKIIIPNGGMTEANGYLPKHQD